MYACNFLLEKKKKTHLFCIRIKIKCWCPHIGDDNVYVIFWPVFILIHGLLFIQCNTTNAMLSVQSLSVNIFLFIKSGTSLKEKIFHFHWDCLLLLTKSFLVDISKEILYSVRLLYLEDEQNYCCPRQLTECSTA